jgi:hypothetical protein
MRAALFMVSKYSVTAPFADNFEFPDATAPTEFSRDFWMPGPPNARREDERKESEDWIRFGHNILFTCF